MAGAGRTRTLSIAARLESLVDHTPARTAAYICCEPEVALLLTDPSLGVTLLRRSLEAALNQQARRERASNGAACACGRVCHGGKGGAARWARLHAQADVALGAVVAAHQVVADRAAGQAAKQAAQLQAGHLCGRARRALVLRARPQVSWRALPNLLGALAGHSLRAGPTPPATQGMASLAWPQTSCPRHTGPVVGRILLMCLLDHAAFAESRISAAARQLCGAVCLRRRARLGTAAQAAARRAATPPQSMQAQPQPSAARARPCPT